MRITIPDLSKINWALTIFPLSGSIYVIRAVRHTASELYNTANRKVLVFSVKILPISDLCWNGFTHAQLLNIRILVEFCISGIHCSNSFKYLPIAVS